MLFVILSQITLVVSLGGMVFLFAKKIPELAKAEIEINSSPKGKALKKLIKRKAASFYPKVKKKKEDLFHLTKRKTENRKEIIEQIENERDYWDKISK